MFYKQCEVILKTKGRTFIKMQLNFNEDDACFISVRMHFIKDDIHYINGYLHLTDDDEPFNAVDMRKSRVCIR